MISIDNIQTEKRNENSTNIDRLNTYDMLKLINDEDKLVAESVEKVLNNVSEAVDAIYEKLKNGGRLIYCGAGSSGRLGVLDAVECPPTYGVDYNMVVALIAGGDNAFVKAKEGAEDDQTLGEADLKRINFCEKDILVGIAASGRTPYVIGAMKYAKTIGTKVISLSCMPNSEISYFSDIDIAPNPGPEVVTGSTRMKSGTAQKMVLNMLSTGAMIKLGKTYGNLMVDVKASNLKLIERAKNIVVTATGVTKEKAEEVLKNCDFSAKNAIVMILAKTDYTNSNLLLEKYEGKIYLVLNSLKNNI